MFYASMLGAGHQQVSLTHPSLLAALNQCDGGGVTNHSPARGRHGQLQAEATEGVCTENQARGMA